MLRTRTEFIEVTNGGGVNNLPERSDSRFTGMPDFGQLTERFQTPPLYLDSGSRFLAKAGITPACLE
jgi:hypothetical protein